MSGAAPESSTLVEAARCLLSAAQERGLTIAVAESLTGGGVVSALVGVPGASAVVVGGVVAYATRLKAELLAVDPARLEPLVGADRGLSPGGVAGPGPADGQPAGTVHVAVASPWGTVRRRLSLEGDRSVVREGATTAVLALAVGLLDASADR